MSAGKTAAPAQADAAELQTRTSKPSLRGCQKVAVMGLESTDLSIR